MPLQETSGAASYDAFGGGVAAVPNYIEDVFSTWLYTGNGSALTINNGIDLAGKGGLVWTKARSNAFSNYLVDSARGTSSKLSSNSTAASSTDSQNITSFNVDGFSVGTTGSTGSNGFDVAYASWTFREQAKFFDCVTYTGTGSVQNIAHNLGSAPGFIIVKATSTTGDWWVYHRSLGATQRIQLNATFAASANADIWNNTEPTSTVFTVGASTASNNSGTTYVAYLYAHNAGGFGLSGTDNVISCGSFTTNGSGAASVNLGYEPQWILMKSSSANDTYGWFLVDNMRGWTVGGNEAQLVPNTTAAEALGNISSPTATGFDVLNLGISMTYIYIAIRRGPMKTPTTGTSVYAPIASGDSTGTQQTTGFPVDAQFTSFRSSNSANTTVVTRLTGVNSPNLATAFPFLLTSASNAESTAASRTNGWSNTGFLTPSFFASNSAIYWNFRRAPGFMDVVCYRGDDTYANSQRAHNLGVPPELTIIKNRTSAESWQVLWNQQRANLNVAFGFDPSPYTANTSTLFSTSQYANGSSSTNYVAYLFASCPGVSKVGSYTGNGSSQTINMGFTGGARFFLVKRTDNTGDWFVFDSARGIVAAGDPFLRWNLTNGEQSGADAVDADSSGIIVNQESTCNINVNGAGYFYLGIA